ncbi:MAG: zinc-binding dehydrogenase [Anaerolineales bacterium]|nr:zinc-binding dehydrogenase [Anaerolineales bacterium]
MKALQVLKPRYFEQVQAVMPDRKTAGPDRILVQPEWVSMCGSDIPFFTGGKRHKTYPLPVATPIHECAGQVVDSTSSLFQPGDRVVAIPDSDQGLSEYFVAQAAKAVKLPSDLKDNGTSCLIQPLSTVINAIDRLGNVEGKSVAVVGLGSIGLFFCWMLKKRGATRIVGIDPIEERCRVAARMGATDLLTARSLEVLHAARQNPGGWGAPDICIEAVGHQMETLNDCLGLVRQRGTVLAFGVPDQPVYAFECETFFRKNAHLVACVTPNWSEYLAISRDIFIDARDELEPLVTHHFPIRDAGQAFTMYEKHEDGILKALIDMSDW